jgi:HK97 family phage portal protein
MTQPLTARVGGLLKKIGSSLERKGYLSSYGLNAIAAYKGINIENIRISVDSLFTVWRNQGDVFAAIRELAYNVGSNGYTWENDKDPDKDARPADYAEMERVFKASGGLEAIKRRMVRDVHIAGNAYFHIQKAVSGKVLKLVPIDARTMQVVCKEDGSIVSWIQKVGMKTQAFKPEEIFQFKTEDDPNSPVYGLSPLEPVIWEVRTDIAALLSNYSFFQNSARPDTQYILDETLSDEQQEDVIRQLQDSLTGAENHHKALAIKGVKDVKTLTVNPRDMEYNILRRFTTEKVCSVLGVPKTILNYTDGVNYSTNDGQYRKFWEGTIQPLNRMVAEALTRLAKEQFGVQESSIKFNDRHFDTEESVREDLKLGIITINEARQKRGMDYYDPAEMGEFVDKAIIFNGTAAIPVVDVGQDPQPMAADPANGQDQSKAVKLFKELAQRYLYGRPKA